MRLDTDEAARLAVFLAQRTKLLRLAYRHLGSVSEAQDIVQDAWLKFAGAENVQNGPRLLSVIVTRLCLDQAKSAAARRLSYVGEWLPEPADASFEDASDAALDISFAVMRTLERLSPSERAAFFLHDVWDLSFEEVGAALAKSPAACRKLASRARAALIDARTRFKPSSAELDRLVAAFEASLRSGDPSSLKTLLSADIQLVTDGGGRKIAALNVIVGPDAVARFLLGVAAKTPEGSLTSISRRLLNGSPALLVMIGGELDSTYSFDLDADGRVRGIYVVRNPEKLAHISADGATPEA